MDKTEKAAVISVLVNFAMLAVKYALGVFSGSMALIADALHSLTDIVASAVVYIGVKISRQKTEKFPYGLYKVENLISLGISLAILWVGYEIAREAVTGGTRELTNVPVTLAGIFLTIFSTYLLGCYKIRVGRETGSPSLISDGYHSKADTFTSIAVFIGVMSTLFGYNLERIATLAVVAIIFKSGFSVMIDAFRVLLDASLDYQVLEKIREIILAHPAVHEIKLLKGRNSGRYKFIEAKVALRTNDLEKACSISEKIKENIRAEVPQVEQVIIYYEPVDKSFIRYAVPLADQNGELSNHFGRSPYFGVVDIKDGKLLRQQIIANPYLNQEKQKGIYVAKLLADEKIDVLVTREDIADKGPSYILSDAGTRLIVTNATKLEDVFQCLV